MASGPENILVYIINARNNTDCQSFVNEMGTLMNGLSNIAFDYFIFAMHQYSTKTH